MLAQCMRYMYAVESGHVLRMTNASQKPHMIHHAASPPGLVACVLAEVPIGTLSAPNACTPGPE